MPIHIPIYINEKLIKTYHIGRVQGDTNPDSINDYLIVEDDQLWNVGKPFTHRYGDGVEVCIVKGFQAIEKELKGCEHINQKYGETCDTCGDWDSTCLDCGKFFSHLGDELK